MVQSKALRPEWLPAVALSAVLAALMLVWDPQVGDLAAQVFHTELFEHTGLAIWNGSWYAGHYTLNYSLLFPPAAALVGPQVVGLLAVVASSYLFDQLVRDHWGAEARWATLWFAAGVVTLLADGQLTFAFGVAFGLAALRELQEGRRTLAVLAAAACPLASPVAGAFLAGILAAGLWERGERLNRTALGAAAIALVLTVAPNLAFPEPGRFPFVWSSYIAIPVWCAGALFLTWRADGEGRLRRVVLAYGLASTLIYLTPNALGGNAVRLGALFGGPFLAAILLSHRPLPIARRGALTVPREGAALLPHRRVPAWFYTAVLVVTLTGSLYWQFTASVTQIARSVGDPSTQASYFQPASHWLMTHGGRGTRIEVPPTANHWESAYLAPKFELARGWLRQLDTARDDLFYKEGALTPAHLRTLAAQQRDLLRRPAARRAARLLLDRRAQDHPRRPALPEGTLPRRTLADLRSGRPEADGDAARRRSRQHHPGRPPGLRPRRHPPRPLPRPRQLHPVLVDRPRQRLPPARRPLDRRPHRPHRHLQRRRRLLPRRRLERGDRRREDLLRCARPGAEPPAKAARARRRRGPVVAAIAAVVVLTAQGGTTVAARTGSGARSRRRREGGGEGGGGKGSGTNRSGTKSSQLVRNATPQPGWKPHTGPVPILVYHALGEAPASEEYPGLYVSEPEFEEQMAWLHSQGYEAVTLDQAEDAWYHGGTLPAKPIVITFDNGYPTQVTFAPKVALALRLARRPLRDHRRTPTPLRNRPDHRNRLGGRFSLRHPP